MASALSEAKKLAKYNNELEKANVKLQYNYNKSLADQDRSFQERMANSAHQREIKDLKAAGLNPVLSVTGGNGAATPSGSSTSVSKPNVDMSLPKAVMDMAMAQLNSATQLQMTAMNNANAWQMHTTPSGDSPYGQYHSFLDDISAGTGIAPSIISAAGNAIIGSLGIAGLFKRGKAAKAAFNKIKEYTKSGKGETPKGILESYVNNKSSKSFKTNKNDMDFIIWALKNGFEDTSTASARKAYNNYLRRSKKK